LQNTPKTLAFTGLRPHKLPWGFNEDTPACLSIKISICERLVALIETENVRYMISGMAMGIDLICAEIVLELKKQYQGITLEAAIPFKEQDFLWPQRYRDRYRSVLDKCDDIHVISKKHTNDVYEKRNYYMVDKCGLLLAVWDGKLGGTGNIVRYAKTRGKRIIVIDPLKCSDIVD